MKKYLIISLVSILVLTSCQKSDFIQAADTVTRTTATAAAANPYSPCSFYTIYNQRGPMGPDLICEYTDCNNVDHTEYIDPMQVIMITARPGTVRCLGGTITTH